MLPSEAQPRGLLYFLNATFSLCQHTTFSCWYNNDVNIIAKTTDIDVVCSIYMINNIIKEPREEKSVHWRGVLATIMLIVMIVIICATIVALVYNTRFSYLGSDDYGFSHYAEQLDIVSFVARRYQIWNGRFASDIWYKVLYSIIDIRSHYWLGPLIVIVIFTMLAWYAYAHFLCVQNGTLRERHRLVPGIYLAATLLFIYLLPIRPASMIYAMYAAVPYQIGPAHLLLQMIGLCAVTRAAHRRTGNTWRQVLSVMGLSASALFISGYQESFVLISLLYYGVGLLWSLLHSRRTVWIWIAPSVMAIIGGLIVYFAPGNDVRIEALSSIGIEVFTANDATVLTVLNHARTILYSGVLRFLTILFASLFVVSHIPPLKKYISLYVRLFDNFVFSCTLAFRIILIVAYPALVVAGALPAVYAFGSIGPERVHAMIYFFLIASFGIFYASLRATAKSIRGRFFYTLKHIFKGKVAIGIRYTIVVVAIVASIASQYESVRDGLPIPTGITVRIANAFPSTVSNLIRDALYAGPQYSAQRERLYESIANLPDKQEAHITIPPFCPEPKSIVARIERISDDSDDYVNSVLASELGIASIHIDPELHCYNNSRLIVRR